MEKDTIRRLHRNLSNTAKSIRHRRYVVNIHITFLTWVMELFRGYPDVKTALPIILASSAHHSSRPSDPVGQTYNEKTREK